MTQSLRRNWVLAIGAMLASASLALGADRPVSDILKEIDASKLPVLDRARRSDQSYVQDYLKKRTEAMETRSKLILELYKAAPDNDRVPALMAERWGSKTPVRVRRRCAAQGDRRRPGPHQEPEAQG